MSQPQPANYDQDLIVRLKAMAGNNAGGVLTIDELSRWIQYADKNRANWQRWYYGGRTTVTVVAAAVTALASASTGLSGSAGLSTKIAAAILSFIVAATNGVLEVWQVANRWRLYRVLRNRLWQAGWRLAAAGAPREFQSLTRDVSAALSDFEHQYLMQVVLSQTGAGAEKTDEQGGSTGGQTAGRPDDGDEGSGAST